MEGGKGNRTKRRERRGSRRQEGRDSGGGCRWTFGKRKNNSKMPKEGMTDADFSFPSFIPTPEKPLPMALSQNHTPKQERDVRK